VTTRFTLTVLYAGIVATAGGWYILALLFRCGDAGAISSTLYFVPALGVLFGALFLSEPLRPSLIIGIVLISLGVRLVVTQPLLKRPET